MPGGTVHFWTLRSLDRLDDWDPDRDPARFADAFLELFVRLRGRGRPVAIGPEVPAGPRAIVALLEELASYDGEVRPGAVRRRLQAGGAERAAAFATDRVLDQWEALFDDDLPSSPPARAATAVVVNDARVALRRVTGG